MTPAELVDLAMRSRPTLAVSCRWACLRDRAQMRRIDLAAASAPHGRPAWGLEAIAQFSRQPNSMGMVAVGPHGEIAGYMLYTLRRDRIELADFVVHPEARRQLVGWQMMGRLKGKLGTRRHRLTWCVRETCLDAQLFARACGLAVPAKGGVVRGAFGDTGESGYTFVYRPTLAELEGEDMA